MRKALAVVIALTLSGVMIVLGRSLIPREPIALLVLALTWLSMSGLIYYLAYAAVRFWIRPFHGRLLDEINEVKRELCHSTSLEALASTVLNKFRKASGDLKAEPVLWTLDPEWELRIDGAGFGRVEQRGAPRALREAVCAQPHETFVRSQLELLRIRRPDLREVIQSLVDMDALCALPLVYEGEVNGILLIPRGRRRSPLSFEELNALQELMASMASVLGMLADHYTAHERYKNERILREQLQEQLHKAHEEIAQWRKSNTVLRRHRAFQAWDWPLVMHSDDMKEVERHMDVFAPLDVPVLIQAYSFREALTVAQAMHDKSAFKEGPFVVADCGLVGPEFARTALFGDPSCETDLAAWVALARHGTLVLKDVVALPIEVQEELASFMAERKHSSGRLLEFRVVATIREPLSELVNTKRLASSLVQRLRSQVLEIPSLALRQEDMPTLVLAALDRAIHRTGRATMGLEAGVLERLRMHSWPGDVEELETVITNAVLRAEGDMLRVDDVAFYGDTVQSLDGDPYFGTYASLEQQILQKAIERAGGNKSEAARALGLKRTTFIDKLRRFNLEDMDSENAGEHAA
jgi:two-component system response regulator HydG